MKVILVHVPVTVFDDADSLGRALATQIADGIEKAAADRCNYVLGCPGGRSAHSTYRALAVEVRCRGLDLGHVTIAMMDEYLVPAEGADRLRAVDPALPHSCSCFGRVEIVEPLNAAAGLGRGLAPDQPIIPDPDNPAAYDELLTALGGVDLFLLASGASDGHIAFNPPGTPAATRTWVTRLADRTRQDNLATFPSFGGLDDVPEYGVTVGVGTIREQSKRVVMVAHGADKAAAARRLAAATTYEPDWPATIFATCANPELYLDAASARGWPPHPTTYT
jgi:glucosamine-6-phosphate deaminase